MVPPGARRIMRRETARRGPEKTGGITNMHHSLSSLVRMLPVMEIGYTESGIIFRILVADNGMD